jgi:hypothetical protein
MEHAVALIGLLYLPLAVMSFLLVADIAARRHVQIAERFMSGYMQSSPAAKGAALAMSMAAAIHFSMVFTHYAGDTTLAVLFAGYAVTVALLCVGLFLARRAVVFAAVVMVSGLLGYALFVATGREVVDTIGLTSKLIEGAALLLLISMIPGKKEVIYA